MFYCDPCGKKGGYPTSETDPIVALRQSFGPCEICGNTGPCNDVPSSRLPLPKKVESQKD